MKETVQKILQELFLFTGIDFPLLDKTYHILDKAILREYVSDEILLSKHQNPCSDLSTHAKS